MTPFLNRRRALPVLVARRPWRWRRWPPPAIVWNGEQRRVDAERADAADRAAADLRSQFDADPGRPEPRSRASSPPRKRVTRPRVRRASPRGLLPRLAGGARRCWSRACPTPLRRSFERVARQRADPRPRRRRGSRRAPARADYYPVSYRFTRAEDRQALPIGLDLAADPVRGAGACARPATAAAPGHRARCALPESGQPRLLVLFLPIYRHGRPRGHRGSAPRRHHGARGRRACEARQLGDDGAGAASPRARSPRSLDPRPPDLPVRAAALENTVERRGRRRRAHLGRCRCRRRERRRSQRRPWR